MKKSIFILAACLTAATLQAQTLFSENFEHVNVVNEVGPLPDGWLMYADNLTNQSGFTIFGSGWVISQVETANKAAASVSYVTSSADCDRWLITPSIEVPGNNYTLKFRAFVNETSAPERLRVAVSTGGTDKGDFTTTLRDITFNGTAGTTAGWNNIELSLDAFAGQTVRIAFVNHGNGQFIFVDDVRINTTTDNYHMALMETFTSQYCGQCPQGHTYEEGAYVGLEDRVAWVSHHAGFQNDAFTVPASTQLESLYGATTYAPAIMFDRDRKYSTASDPGPVHYVGDSYSMHQQLSRATTEQDNIVLGFTSIDYDPATRQLQATLDGYFIHDHAIAQPRLTIYLLEDSLIAFQSYGTGNHDDYRHDHVLRACLTDPWGDSDPFSSTAAGATFSKSVSYTLPTTFRADQCHLVAFVSNYGTAINDRQVHNTTKSGAITTDAGHVLGIDDPASAGEAQIYPNPAADRVSITADATIRAYRVVSMTGQTLLHHAGLAADILDLDVTPLVPGLYFVLLTTDRGPVTTRLSVVR